MRFRRIAAVAGAALAVALIVLASTNSASYQDCQAQIDQNANGDQHQYPLYEVAKDFAVCEAVTFGANAALISAAATVVIAAFTLTLWLVTAEALRQSRAEFVATFRPRIKVRGVNFAQEPNGDAVMHFSMVNAGSSTARVYQWIISADLLRTLPAIPEYPAPIDIEIMLGPGESFGLPLRYKGDAEAAFFAQNAYDPGSGDGHVFIYGFVRYRDDNGTVRETGFCREFNGERFVSVQNDDWEYG